MGELRAVGVNVVHVVVPEGIDDATRPSGGNTYDRQLIDTLRTQGFAIVETAVAGSWPFPPATALEALARTLSAVADGSVVLLDGLVASASSDVLVPHASRLRLVILMHMPLGSEPGALASVKVAERVSLTAATAVITTSTWTRRWLIDHYGMPPGSVHVAEPGVEPSEVASVSAHGGRLICVAAVVPHKGQDILVEALARLTRREWDCRFVGSDTLDPGFVARLRRGIQETDLADRIQFVGPLVGAALASTYASADLLVAPSRTDTYGMVVSEALAHGTPVVATTVGGLPSTLGIVEERGRPGILVPPDDPMLLAEALRTWLDDDSVRRRLRELALDRRRTLSPWTSTARDVSHVLRGVAA
ncbi:MAG: glycosyltransferase family 4 protein [Actinobacteria bacterium]|nr:glycosyltransferase family 4 protein [Actinomycetota bacterium]